MWAPWGFNCFLPSSFSLNKTHTPHLSAFSSNSRLPPPVPLYVRLLLRVLIKFLGLCICQHFGHWNRLCYQLINNTLPSSHFYIIPLLLFPCREKYWPKEKSPLRNRNRYYIKYNRRGSVEILLITKTGLQRK